MTSRVALISPAMNRSLREACFDDGTRLDASGTAQARSAAHALRAANRVLVSPTVRCRETAAALGLDAAEAPELAGLDVGRWTGRRLAGVAAEEPGAVAHWLDASRTNAGRTLAVVGPEIVRAAVLTVLGAPEATFWRLDVPPLTATDLSGRAGRWNLRIGLPLGRPQAEEAEAEHP
ncbi:histidine phosphatase family protein [Streptomyces griseoruber]|uniref:histidine phosphatase family protein n=1 Tax=Streptomyces griseoruber TaxID=1943 RepID=UPI0037A29E66